MKWAAGRSYFPRFYCSRITLLVSLLAQRSFGNCWLLRCSSTVFIFSFIPLHLLLTGPGGSASAAICKEKQ